MKSSTEMIKSYAAVAEKKTSLPVLKMLVSGMLAGIFIGLGGYGSQFASTAIGGTAGRVVGACVFPVGLFLVVTVGAELFTGNCLLVIPWYEAIKTRGVAGLNQSNRSSDYVGISTGMHSNNNIRIVFILRNWLFVYIGNFIGSVLLALAIYASGLGDTFDGALAQTAVSAATAKIGLSFGVALVRGILCNFLVCLAVWVSMMAEDVIGKFIAVFAPVMLFVLCGFEHSVANMFFIPLGMLYDSSIGIGQFLIGNILPVTIGNIVGGAICVGGGIYSVYS